MDQEKTDKGWLLIEHCVGHIKELVEVSPENDIREHVPTGDCECIPTTGFNESGIPLIIHNAFDGRDAVEQNERGN